MITRELLIKVLDSQNASFERRSMGSKRELLEKIPHALGFASIITGLRRCGKSTLLKQIKSKHYADEGLFLNFEDPRLAGFEINDYERLYDEIISRNSKVIFLDEIQNAPGWEVFVNLLLREDFIVYITGSNASLLSKELGTHLTGRHLSSELFPFSYTEFLSYYNQDTNLALFKEYSLKGGMPDYLRTGLDQYLNTVLEDSLIRDIAIRYGIRDVGSLRQLTVYLLSNIGSLTSANKLKGLFGIKSSTTLLEYFSYLQDAYIFGFVPLYDYSIKKQIRNPQKVYAIDMGIYHQNKIVFSNNDGHILENMVYLHLRRVGNEIYYFHGKGECDFIHAKNGIPKELYQVCFEINSLNKDRELNGLFEAMAHFKIYKATIITWDQEDLFTRDQYTINVDPAWKWMSRQ